MAGFLLEVHRALHHLVSLGVGECVGVEALDDVVVVAADGSESWEQDKLTLADDGAPLTDRSSGFWRSLDIWTKAWLERDLGGRGARFFLVTNRTVTGAALALLTKTGRSEAENKKILGLLMEERKSVGKAGSKSLQGLINDVLDKGEDVLLCVIARTHLQAGPGHLDFALFEHTKARLPFAGIGCDDDIMHQSLVGWIQLTLLQCWFAKEEGWITVEAFKRQAYKIAGAMQKQVVLPRAARLLPVSADDVEQVRDHRFVEHLGMVEVVGERLDVHLGHYVRFIREKLRLAESGDILEDDWLERADRLREHWQTIKDQQCLDHADEPRVRIGRRILLEASKLREPLAETEMLDAYMTLGHFHRLADADGVAWHPDFDCSC
ncbi:hypothetical protein FW320_00525 [Azospirillum sp. Vi22]|uniref:ABC-three component system protein n=1 Tax=Azospirillum baldaniorum TaxID=1064539 RepID=UPI00157A6626|nr:ABC-three component system protein [Azospirillum baldaniorum]NUB04680.1 hypothetical protein [Azospirillum baldaniorum]